MLTIAIPQMLRAWESLLPQTDPSDRSDRSDSSRYLRAFAATGQAITGDRPPKSGDRQAISGDRQAIAHEGIGDKHARIGDKQAIGQYCAKGLSRPLPITLGAAAGAGPGQRRDCPWGSGLCRAGDSP